MERSAEQRSSLARRRPVRGRDEWGIEFSRIVAFSDGVFAIAMAAVSLTFQAQIGYSFRNDLLRPELRELEHRVVEPANLIVAAVFLLSIPVAFVSPLAAVLMWPIIFLTGRRLAFRIADLRS